MLEAFCTAHKLGCDTTWESVDASKPESMTYKVIDSIWPRAHEAAKGEAREGRVNPKVNPMSLSCG